MKYRTERICQGFLEVLIASIFGVLIVMSIVFTVTLGGAL